jgi:ATP-dependent protease ClpP protease subunit
VRRKSEIEQLINNIHTFCIDITSRELYLHSNYCIEEEGVEYSMATRFVKNLHVLENIGDGPVLVHMQTPGGDWSHGMAMFDAVRFSPLPVAFVGYSQASSMSGIILQSADVRVLAPNCEFMIHHGSISVEDHSMAAKSAVEMNAKYCRKMLEIFARRAVQGVFFKKKKYSEADVIAFIDAKIREKVDWYISSVEEALYYGFCDGILGQKNFKSFEEIKEKCKKQRF